jgi:hypothetical protein
MNEYNIKANVVAQEKLDDALVLFKGLENIDVLGTYGKALRYVAKELLFLKTQHEINIKRDVFIQVDRGNDWDDTSVIVENKQWHQYSLDYELDGRKFSTSFYALNDIHAQTVVAQLKITAKAGDRILAIIKKN